MDATFFVILLIFLNSNNFGKINVQCRTVKPISYFYNSESGNDYRDTDNENNNNYFNRQNDGQYNSKIHHKKSYEEPDDYNKAKNIQKNNYYNKQHRANQDNDYSNTHDEPGNPAANLENVEDNSRYDFTPSPSSFHPSILSHHYYDHDQFATTTTEIDTSIESETLKPKNRNNNYDFRSSETDDDDHSPKNYDYSETQDDDSSNVANKYPNNYQFDYSYKSTESPPEDETTASVRKKKNRQKFKEDSGPITTTPSTTSTTSTTNNNIESRNRKYKNRKHLTTTENSYSSQNYIPATTFATITTPVISRIQSGKRSFLFETPSSTEITIAPLDFASGIIHNPETYRDHNNYTQQLIRLNKIKNQNVPIYDNSTNSSPTLTIIDFSESRPTGKIESTIIPTNTEQSVPESTTEVKKPVKVFIRRKGKRTFKSREEIPVNEDLSKESNPVFIGTNSEEVVEEQDEVIEEPEDYDENEEEDNKNENEDATQQNPGGQNGNVSIAEDRSERPYFFEKTEIPYIDHNEKDPQFEPEENIPMNTDLSYKTHYGDPRKSDPGQTPFEYSSTVTKVLHKPLNFVYADDQKISASDDHEEKEEDEKKKKGGGEQYHSGHKETKGGKDKKGYKDEQEYDKGKKGHHDKEERKKLHLEEKGKKKKHKDESGHYGEHNMDVEGKKAAKFKEVEKHKEGYSTKGSHNVHKKNEFMKKHEFYDEHHEDDDHKKHGGFHEEHNNKKGGQLKKGYHESDFDNAHKGKQGKKVKGKIEKEKKGHNAEAEKEKESEHKEKYGEKDSEGSNKKWKEKEAN